MYKKKIEKRKKIIIFVLPLMLGFIFSFNFSNMQSDYKNVEEINPMISALTSPISIDDTIPGSDWAWAVTQPWCTGSGTEGDPYLLEDLTIDGGGTDSGILIVNSKAYFTIRDCTLYNAGGINPSGVYLGNVANGTITMNNCSNNSGGIYLYDSSHNNIVGNIMDGPDSATGISLILSHNNTIDNNNVKNKYQGIRLETSSDNIILDNTAEKNYNFGILLLYGSIYNTVSGNIVKNNTNADGIVLLDSNNNIISENTVSDNNWEGIDVAGGMDNVLSDNTIFNNGQSGITLWTNFGSGDSNENYITGNTIYNNSQHGIYLQDSDDNIIEQNNVNNNMLNGIFLLTTSNYNSLSENSISDNIENGIVLDTSYYNTMSDNLISDNLLHGISLIGSYSDYNNITKNKIYHNNESGIYIGDDMWHNDIWDNEIYDNTMHGIYLDSSGYGENYGNWIYDNKEFGIYCALFSYDNLFYENVFVRNKKHAVDDGSNNLWNNTDIGNYWDNHTGPDANSDGIVDIEYDITGFATSIDYLPIAEDGAPIITIVSPNAGDVFNETAPDFTITVTDDFLYSMWYTIDGGPTEYPFTSFSGTIDQGAWDALSDGDVTLTFYASDLPGNTGTDEVVIEKDTQAPVITINSPADGEVFGNTPPSFNITITEPNLDTIWYTVNSNFTIIDSTLIWTINQTIWSALPEGSVTITIYANDTLGHISSEEVTITKNIPSAAIGLDSVTTSVLIFLISGVAIISIITRMYHKKRIIS